MTFSTYYVKFAFKKFDFSRIKFSLILPFFWYIIYCKVFWGGTNTTQVPCLTEAWECTFLSECAFPRLKKSSQTKFVDKRVAAGGYEM